MINTLTLLSRHIVDAIMQYTAPSQKHATLNSLTLTMSTSGRRSWTMYRASAV